MSIVRAIAWCLISWPIAAAAQATYSWRDITQSQLGAGQPAPAGTHIAAHPLDAHRLIATFAAAGRTQLYVSADSGSTWRMVAGAPRNLGTIEALFAHRGRPGVVYVQETDGRTFRSTDFGDSWTELQKPGDAITLRPFAEDPVNPDRIFATQRTKATTSLVQSWDLGATWGPADGRLDSARSVDDAEGPKPSALARLFQVRGGSILVSKDSAIVWEGFTSTLGDVAWVRQDPRRAAVVYALRPSGDAMDLLRTDNNGASWRTLLTFGGVRGTPALTIDPVRGQELWLTGAPQGLLHSTDSGDHWDAVGFPASSGGFATEVVPDLAERGAAFVASNGRLYRGSRNATRQAELIEYKYDPLQYKYWLAVSVAEALSQDFRAEPGFVRRTGIRIGVWQKEDAPAGAVGSCRFWGGATSTRPPRRAIALQGPECEALKRDPAWTLEAENEFYALRTLSPDVCPGGTLPVWDTSTSPGIGTYRYIVDVRVTVEIGYASLPYLSSIVMCSRRLEEFE